MGRVNAYFSDIGGPIMAGSDVTNDFAKMQKRT